MLRTVSFAIGCVVSVFLFFPGLAYKGTIDGEPSIQTPPIAEATSTRDDHIPDVGNVIIPGIPVKKTQKHNTNVICTTDCPMIDPDTAP